MGKDFPANSFQAFLTLLKLANCNETLPLEILQVVCYDICIAVGNQQLSDPHGKMYKVRVKQSGSV